MFNRDTATIITKMGRSSAKVVVNSNQLKSRSNQAQLPKRSLQQLESIDKCQAKDQDIEKSNGLSIYSCYVNGKTVAHQQDFTARCSTKETTKVLSNSPINEDHNSTNTNNDNISCSHFHGDSKRNCCIRNQGSGKWQNSGMKPTSNLLSSSKLDNSLLTNCCCDVTIKDLCCHSNATRCCPVVGEVKKTSLIGSAKVDENKNHSNNNNKYFSDNSHLQYQKQTQAQKQQQRTVINSLPETGKVFYEPHLAADEFISNLLLPMQQNLSKNNVPTTNITTTTTKTNDNNMMDNSSNNNNRISRSSNRCADDSDDFVCCALSVTSPSLSLASSSDSFIHSFTPNTTSTSTPVRQIKSNNLDFIDGSNIKLQTARQQPFHDCRQLYDNNNYDHLSDDTTTEQVGWIKGIQASDKTSELDYSNRQNHHHNYQQQQLQLQQFSKLKNSVNLSQQNQTSLSSCCSCYSKNNHLSKCLFKSNAQAVGIDEPVKLTQVNGESCCGVVSCNKNCSGVDKNRYFSTLLDNENTKQTYTNYLRKINNNNKDFDHHFNRINTDNQHQDSISKQKLNQNYTNNNSNKNNNKYQILISSSTSESSAPTSPVAGKSPSLLREQEDINKSSLEQLEDFYQPKNQHWNHLDWRGVAKRYREMPRQHRGQFWWRMRQSCFCHALFSTIYTLFPILSSFKNYSFPGDLFTDLMAGFTIAILHIPQGMAYGMLSGVEPIYGLYVSFIPVLIMALMSKSLHVSYGTFAVVSMLLANSVESVKLALKQQHQQLVSSQTSDQKSIINSVVETSNSSPSISNVPTPSSSISNGAAVSTNLDGLVLTNNHQPSNPSQRILNNLLVSSSANLNINNNNQQQQQQLPLLVQQQQPYNGLNNNLSTMTLASTGDNGLWTFDIDGGEFLLPSSIEILTSICLLTGMIQIFMSLARLGVLSLMFSDQLVSGFTTASAINVVTSQIAAVFDLSLPVVPEGLFKMCRIWFAFGNKLTEGFNQYTAILSLISIIFLLAVKEIIEPILRKRHKSFTCLPSELVLMSVIIFSSWYWQFETNYDIKIVGTVPTGLPEPSVPRLDIVPLIYQDAITVALISFAMNLSLAQVYAKKFRYTLNPNQELFALGASNFVGSFFNCFPCASSLSRSAIQSNLNVKSQICSLFSCALVVSIICYFAPILHDLPRSTLSCIIIVALKGILVQMKDLYSNWRLSKLDALVWLVTFMSVIALGITYGLILGIVASLFMVFFR